jgi:hypothetical protein
VRPGARHAAHQHRRVDLEDVQADGPGDEGRDRARDETGHEDLQRDVAGQLLEQRGTGIDADDRDERHQAKVLEDVARGVRRAAEERSRDTSDETRMPDSSRPRHCPGRPRSRRPAR